MQLSIVRCVVFSVFLLVLLSPGICKGEQRPVVSLDGIWKGKIDADGVGVDQQWYASSFTFTDTLVVPGSWDAQGFGIENNKVFHKHTGKFWYKKDASVPPEWRGKRIFLSIGGIKRIAKTWVNGHYMGEYVGYVSQFEYDITDYIQVGQAVHVAMEIDSLRNPDMDPLVGESDFIDFMGSGMESQTAVLGTSDEVSWGGIWGHVLLEAREDTYLDELFIRSRISPPEIKISAILKGSTDKFDSVEVVVHDYNDQQVVQKYYDKSKVVGSDKLEIDVEIPNAKFWSPDNPYLYKLCIRLLKSGVLIDEADSRFGLREIKAVGTELILNGKRIFLRGYGDDGNFPETMCPPSDKMYYLNRLKLIKHYGFNFVRHHSHMMPPEYYDACDEIGIMVSAEAPLAYGHKNHNEATTVTYLREWAGGIKRHRNHPCIFDWCIGNEGGGDEDLRRSFKRIAKEFDPDRLFIDTDGIQHGGWEKSGLRDTLDFLVVQFEIFDLPLDVPSKFQFSDDIVKPIVSHETGNYCTFPRFDQIKFFKHNMKPFWLTYGRDKVASWGLLDEVPLWSRVSERYYLLCHKLNLEALRKNPLMSGYHWWLFQDFWVTNNGIVDLYFRQKSIRPDEVMQFNNDIVLLEDGLQRSYSGGKKLGTVIKVSNFSEDNVQDEQLTCELYVDNKIVIRNLIDVELAKQAGLIELAKIEYALPDTKVPKIIELKTELSVGKRRIYNHWISYLFPKEIAVVESNTPVYASQDLLPLLDFLKAQKLTSKNKYLCQAVYVTNTPNKSVLDAVRGGACLIMLAPKDVFETSKSRFKLPWWSTLWREHGVNGGALFYDNPITEGLAPEGWVDAAWYELLEDASGVVLNNFEEQPVVMVRGIEDPIHGRNKAFLFQIGLGRGSVIVSGFNHLKAKDMPVNQWLIKKIIDYAMTLPKTNTVLPNNYFEEHSVVPQHPGGSYLLGYKNLLRMEGEEVIYLTYLEQNAIGYYCRQTKEGNLIEWQTAPVPEDVDDQKVSFVFAGGLGWAEEPDGGGFDFWVNGKDVLDFDLAFEPFTWNSDDGLIELRYIPKRLEGQTNGAGFFYVTIPRYLFTAGKPCILGVTSKGNGSRRWFSLHPYTDIVDWSK